MMVAIEMINLGKKFRDRIAVDKLNLSIYKGEMFALLGENGAGKSTTIKMLSCLTRPTSGDAILMGNSVLNNEKEIKKIINVSPQETAVATKISIRENLELVARIYGKSKEQAKLKTDELLNKFNLQERANDRVKTLSGGMKRKLSIAMAIISEPDILFLDEPTLGLDVRARKELWKSISRLKGEVTIILTTHYLEEAEALADRIAIMDKGKLKVVGTAKEIMEEAKTKTFEDAFLELSDGGEY